MSLVVPQEGGAELILKIINGRVKEISFAHEELVLSYRHPVTGREEELGLKVDTNTSFNQGLHLNDFKKGDPVSVDYEEESSGILRAKRINRVDVSGVPEEIAQFRR